MRLADMTIIASSCVLILHDLGSANGRSSVGSAVPSRSPLVLASLDPGRRRCCARGEAGWPGFFTSAPPSCAAALCALHDVRSRPAASLLLVSGNLAMAAQELSTSAPKLLHTPDSATQHNGLSAALESFQWKPLEWKRTARNGSTPSPPSTRPTSFTVQHRTRGDRGNICRGDSGDDAITRETKPSPEARSGCSVAITWRARTHERASEQCSTCSCRRTLHAAVAACIIHVAVAVDAVPLLEAFTCAAAVAPPTGLRHHRPLAGAWPLQPVGASRRNCGRRGSARAGPSPADSTPRSLRSTPAWRAQSAADVPIPVFT
ncbi:hypothetical protein ON010_g5427 [Phytophthora cinnamomi]|nr:hypothetical protein ON010_g5427 [Phytophthora cinnamomi]